jgi:hypothetical protein
MTGAEAEFGRRKERSDTARMAATRLRDTANTLIGNAAFREWAGDVLVRNGFFDSRELTPYSQGVRGGIVKEIERLMEAADDGADFLAAVFREKVVGRSTR